MVAVVAHTKQMSVRHVDVKSVIVEIHRFGNIRLVKRTAVEIYYVAYYLNMVARNAYHSLDKSGFVAE